jgi:D-glycero-alpha-D-manno-heptose-7-phosphate kinase
MPGNKTIMTQIPLALQEMKRLKEHFLLLYTGVQRNASEQLVAQSKGARSKYQLYDEMKKLTYEFAGELKNGIWKNLGTFLDDGWQIKRRLSNGISSAAIDDMYDRAKKSGAVGAKLLGAGGGGFLLVFAPPETHDAILKSLPELRPVNFNMTIEGSKVRVLHEGGV